MELYTLTKKHNALSNKVVAMNILADSEEQARQLACNEDNGSCLWLTGHVTVMSRPLSGSSPVVDFDFQSEEPVLAPQAPSVISVKRLFQC